MHTDTQMHGWMLTDKNCTLLHQRGMHAR